MQQKLQRAPAKYSVQSLNLTAEIKSLTTFKTHTKGIFNLLCFLGVKHFAYWLEDAIRNLHVLKVYKMQS